MPIYTCWQAPDRDSVTITFSIETTFGKPETKALLQMEGERGTVDEEVLRVTGVELSRARRWHKIFERMGILYTSQFVTRLSDLGRILLNPPVSQKDLTAFRGRVARAAVSVLKKYQLKNPADETPENRYPEDCNIHPYYAIWKAASELDWKLHWDELNRELMRVMRHDELSDVIERIRQARQQPDYNAVTGGSAQFRLRERCYTQVEGPGGRDPDGQVRDQKTTPWFRRAGFGGLLLESPGSEGRGYWYVPEYIREIISEAIAQPPEYREFNSKDEWFAYFGTVDAEIEIENEPAIDDVPLTIIDWSRTERGTEDLCNLIGIDDAFSQAIGALRAKKHLILVGPPGTGKTQLALCICKTLGMEPDLVTATSDWTTFDTIGGYFPDPRIQGTRNAEPLNFFPGVVLQSLKREHWLIIDEINRADIDKAFGELFTVLSGGSVRLPFKTRQGDNLRDVVLGDTNEDDVQVFRIPDHWRIIGTMNTFDKSSLYQLSYAFMRRFAFVSLPIPARDHYSRILENQMFEGIDGDREYYADCLGHLNQIFATDDDEGLGRLGLRVGPAIPLDIISFIKSRRSVNIASARLGNSKELVLQGIEMYLYPQFEGRDRDHKDIIDFISATLDLDQATKKKTNDLLVSWTGHETKLVRDEE